MGPAVQAQTVGNHEAVYDARGILLPWTSWDDALEREMNWYARSPIERGYPRFVFMTFMDDHYELIPQLLAFIPAMQNGMGIISYLKYYTYKGKKDPRVLQFARAMGDYLVRESLTPDTGKYPRFTRSTGWAARFPQPPDSGSFEDRPYEIEPDKGGIAGFALVLLYEATKDETYMRQALQNARVLVANMRRGDANCSPWPFRADYRTGAARGDVSGNMSFILRLFDKLIEHGYGEFQAARAQLWSWIKTYQIPNAAKDGLLWNQFFEDIPDLPDNRTAWAPLNMARYLIEQKERLDPEWQVDAKTLIDFTIRRFTVVSNGIAACGEQDYHMIPWGGIVSTYGAVLAMYCAATGFQEYKALAYQALTFVMYAIDDDGVPGDGSFYMGRGGWQEDAHTDVVHNFMDALAAFPEWAK
jgi:hypothetical protein